MKYKGLRWYTLYVTTTVSWTLRDNCCVTTMSRLKATVWPMWQPLFEPCVTTTVMTNAHNYLLDEITEFQHFLVPKCSWQQQGLDDKTIGMSYWRHTMVDGAKFKISIQWLEILRKAGRWMLIQNLAQSTTCSVNVTSKWKPWKW